MPRPKKVTTDAPAVGPDIKAKVAAASRSYPSRSAAAQAAEREGFRHFRCEFHFDTRRWYFRVMTEGYNPTFGYVAYDWVHHVEFTYRDVGDAVPTVCGVVVVNITKSELDEILTEFPCEDPRITFEPLTRDLWNGGAIEGVKRQTKNGTRATSEVESPVRVVWRIASEMKGKDRKEVIAACIAAGVNKSTASTQFYKWSLANKT